MSAKHPIISVTGSSGAGTTSVRRTFEQIFRREKITAVFVEGDAFHRYDREEMLRQVDEAAKDGNPNLSHFGEEANLLPELEQLFKTYGEIGTGRARALRARCGRSQDLRCATRKLSRHGRRFPTAPMS